MKEELLICVGRKSRLAFVHLLDEVAAAGHQQSGERWSGECGASCLSRDSCIATASSVHYRTYMFLIVPCSIQSCVCSSRQVRSALSELSLVCECGLR